MGTLIDILTGTLSYDNSWAVYAERIDGEFKPESPARFGQTQFENGGIGDNCQYFMNNMSIQDRIDRLSGYTDGTQEEREAIDDMAIREAAEMLIEQVNEIAALL